jgi:hypothetical protein
MTPVDRIFVFGSNEGGIHGAGAALFARNHRGAILRQGRGRQGQSYAIPTKNARFRTRLINEIRLDVNEFLQYAADHPDERFEVTRIGCGLAGYKDAHIAPLFKDAPDNCDLPDGWR